MEKDLEKWNSKIEKNIEIIGQKSNTLKIMHLKQALKLSKTYNILMYLGIILGPLAGLVSAIGSTTTECEDIEIFYPITSMCVGFISGIVVAITKFSKLEEKKSHHKLASSKYTNLESNVKRQLLLDPKQRIKPTKYLEWVGKSFDDLFTNSPLLSKYIYTNYSININDSILDLQKNKSGEEKQKNKSGEENKEKGYCNDSLTILDGIMKYEIDRMNF